MSKAPRRREKRWAAGFEPSPLPTRWRFFLPELTLVKLGLAEGSEASLKQARDLIEFLHGHAVCTHGRRSLVDILALKALLHDQEGDSEAAVLSLREAIELAEPGGVTGRRLVVEMGRGYPRWRRPPGGAV